MNSKRFICPLIKYLRRSALPITLTGLCLALPLQTRAQDSEEEALDISAIKAELAKGKTAPVQKQAPGGNKSLNKEFQRLMAAEAELLNKMGKQPESSDAQEQEQPREIAQEIETEAAELEAPQKRAGQAQRVKKLPQVVPAVLENQEDSEELNDLTMAEPSDIQMEEKVEGQGQKMQKLQKQNVELRAQLEAAQTSAKDLRKELEETRNRLIMAETQVERLSSVIEDRNRNSLSRLGGNVPAVRQAAAQQPAAARYGAPAQGTAEKQPADEMPVATVITDKAHLRTGPGKDNSPLMTVSKGTRLAIETRNGEWYRVISPTGARAWVSADVLAFGNGPSGRPSETRINRAFRASAPNEEASDLTEPLVQGQ